MVLYSVSLHCFVFKFDIVLVGYKCDYKRMPTHHAKHYIVVLIAKFNHTQKLKGNIKTKKDNHFNSV